MKSILAVMICCCLFIVSGCRTPDRKEWYLHYGSESSLMIPYTNTPGYMALGVRCYWRF
jgi:hypothetical protein